MNIPEGADAKADLLVTLDKQLKERGFDDLNKAFEALTAKTEEHDQASRLAEKFRTDNGEAAKMMQGKAAELDIANRRVVELEAKTVDQPPPENKDDDPPPLSAEEQEKHLSDEELEMAEKIVNAAKTDEEKRELLTEKGRLAVIKVVTDAKIAPEQLTFRREPLKNKPKLEDKVKILFKQATDANSRGPSGPTHPGGHAPPADRSSGPGAGLKSEKDRRYGTM